MRILFIANIDKRQRYRFVMEPLASVGVDVTTFHESQDLISDFYKAITLLVKKPSPDAIVLTGGDIRNSIWFFLIRLLTGSRIVLRFGGDPVAVRVSAQRKMLNIRNVITWLRSRVGVFGTRMMLKKADGVISVSDYLANRIKPLTGKNTQLCTSPPVLDLSKPVGNIKSHSRNSFSMLTVANINYYEKADGILMIANALCEYCKVNGETFSVQYDVVGNGMYLAWLEQNINELELPENLSIILHGHQDDVSNFYTKADVFLYHSTLDSYPLVLAEASAYGLPIIINRWGPFPEIFRDKCEALFFESGDVNGLVSQLNIVLKDSEMRASLAKASRENFVRNHSMFERGEHLKEYFSRII